MVVALSYVIAVVLTVALAVVLYPISALFWVLGLLGKISDHMFKSTNKWIKSLWKDILKLEEDTTNHWVCECGCQNTGNFCTICGKSNNTEPEKVTE